MKCAYCQYNDGAVYTSIPPQYKCTITGKFHFDTDDCDVEFKPVKHGYWIKHNHYVECPLCYRTWNSDYNDTYAFSYCPSCGARMDGREND